MRWRWRLVVILITFLGVGYTTMRLLVAHAVAKGSPEYSVRLAGAMGGLFVGGGSAALAALLLWLNQKPSPLKRD